MGEEPRAESTDGAARAARPDGAQEPNPRRRVVLGWIALTLSALAFLAMVLRGPVAEELHADDPPAVAADENAGWLGKAITVAREVKRIKEGTRVRSQHERTVERIGLGAVAAGALGIVLATIGWVLREDHRICGAAATLGLLAVAWQYVVVALALAVVLGILAHVTW